MRTATLAAAALSLIAFMAISPRTTHAATIINFNDGTDGLAVDAFYAGLGVTFSNAQWSSVLGDPLTIEAIDSEFVPTVSTPIVATFDSAQVFVSILGLDVGKNGVRLDAYDQAVSGSLVDFDQYIGTGAGTGVNVTLSTSAPSIRRVEFYLPSNEAGDGVVWDDFTFSDVPVPEPASFIVLAGLALGASHARLRRLARGSTAAKAMERSSSVVGSGTAKLAAALPPDTP